MAAAIGPKGLKGERIQYLGQSECDRIRGLGVLSNVFFSPKSRNLILSTSLIYIYIGTVLVGFRILEACV